MTFQHELDRAGPVVDRLNAAIRDNPLAAGLIGAGIAWMLMGGAKGFGGGNTARQCRSGCLSHRHWEIAQCDFWTGRHHDSVLDRGAQLANVAWPVVSEKRIHRIRR